MWTPAILAIAFGFIVAVPAQGASHSVGTVDPFDAVTATTEEPAAQPPQQDHSQHEPAVSQPNTPEMMQKHRAMMANMAANHAKLEALMKQMDAATGQAKVDRMAQVIAELVRQHRAMHEHMGTMGGCGMTGPK
jgi:type IV secretory pathway VirB10-like protein